ncbi:MAG: hypothetical protein FWD34_10565 [Oscillospiraceae bacterium]|nr:hypothetical protein [Oscillospiraceae bacterium]
MIKLISGKRGSGKTKLLIEEIKAKRKISNGNLVAIQVGNSLNSHVKHDVRLINIEDYNITEYNAMFGFVGGILASDYDCTHIFIDGILRIIGRDMEKVEKMFAGIHSVSGDTEVVFTISEDENDLPEAMKKYL